MRRNILDQKKEPDFGVGFPMGVIMASMLGISIYLVAMGVHIPPPQSSVYSAPEDLSNR